MFKRKSLVLLILVALSVVTLAACAAPSASNPAQPDATATAARMPAAAASLTPNPTVNPSTADAIKSVIQQANQEEVQAVATHDPTVMQDTRTTSYYQQSAQTLKDLLNAGVTAIQLVKLDWGPITQQDAATAQATTYETWSTTYSDGSTMQETDTNVYTLVNQGGAWKLQQDEHPSSRTLQPSSGNPGATTTPAAPITPGRGQSQSRNWSGYNATGGTFTAVSGTWMVPKVSTGTLGIDATWVGIGGVTSQDLIQAGTQAEVQLGQVTYSAWWETLPQASQTVPLDISAGDTVSVVITQQSDGTWQIVMRDTANAQTWQKNLTYQSSLSSSEWVEEAPATGHRLILPLDNFGTVTFTNATTVVNGQQRTIAQAGGKPITMDSPLGSEVAQPSALSASGDSFTVTRTTFPAPRIAPGGRTVPGG